MQCNIQTVNMCYVLCLVGTIEGLTSNCQDQANLLAFYIVVKESKLWDYQEKKTNYSGWSRLDSNQGKQSRFLL